MTEKYDVKIYQVNGREGQTVRGLTYGQKYALITALDEHNITHIVKEVKNEKAA